MKEEELMLGTSSDSSNADSGGEYIYRQEQINNKILSSNISATFFYLPEPVFETKNVVVLLKKNGNPVIVNGQFLYTEKKMSVFKGFVEKKVKLPVENIFNDSVSSAFLTDGDVDFIRDLDLVLSSFIAAMYKEKKQFPKTLTKLLFLKNSFSTTSKGHKGVGALTAKTQINKGESIERLVQEQRTFNQLQEKKDKGFLSGLMG